MNKMPLSALPDAPTPMPKPAALGCSHSSIDFRQVCEASTAGICVVQGDHIVFANPSSAEILGREPEAALGRSPLEFVHPNDRVEVEAHLAQSLSGKSSCPTQVLVTRPDGSNMVVELRAAPLDCSGRQAVVLVMIGTSPEDRLASVTHGRLRFEQLLADLSASFINLPCDQIGPQIDTSLRMLVEFLGNDRSTLVEFGDDQKHVLVSHSFAAPGSEPFPLGPFEVARLPWFINQFRSGEIVFVRDIEQDLPVEADAERQYCRAHGLKSNITIPLKAGGILLGGLTFAFMRSHCVWPREMIVRLQLIGEVFANVLLRSRTELSLRAALAENETIRQQLKQDNLYLREQAKVKHQHGRVIGSSRELMRALADVECVATTDAPVLLTGETGTGKELLAQTIHEMSHRHARPMVVVNCASLPATLVESELFGRAAGAYTGAVSAQVGRFELADGSTLFLDEIGEFPLELQAKLLRVLQDGRFERLGSPKTVSVDVRIIAATNRDLGTAARAGTFRADLFHRLSVFPIHVPPLRERREDIPPLVWSFVELHGRRMGKSITCISRKTMQQLQAYDWPGNVRELSNVIERAMILTRNDVLHADLPITMRSSADACPTLKESEREQILRRLHQSGWRIRGAGGAAELLGLKPTTLEARMNKLGIRRPNKDASPANSNILDKL